MFVLVLSIIHSLLQLLTEFPFKYVTHFFRKDNFKFWSHKNRLYVNKKNFFPKVSISY
jgi:hypothetical protein